MTRKDYRLIAKAIADERTWRPQHLVLDSLAYRLAEALEAEGGFDVNGNRRFKQDVFLSACGVRVCINPEEAA